MFTCVVTPSKDDGKTKMHVVSNGREFACDKYERAIETNAKSKKNLQRMVDMTFAVSKCKLTFVWVEKCVCV